MKPNTIKWFIVIARTKGKCVDVAYVLTKQPTSFIVGTLVYMIGHGSYWMTCAAFFMLAIPINDHSINDIKWLATLILRCAAQKH